MLTLFDMLKIYELKDKHYSLVCKMFNHEIVYEIKDFNGNTERDIALRKFIGDLIEYNLNEYLLNVKDISGDEFIRLIESRDLLWNKVLNWILINKYKTEQMVQGLDRVKYEIRDCAITQEQKKLYKLWMEGMEVINRVVKRWKDDNDKLFDYAKK